VGEIGAALPLTCKSIITWAMEWRWGKKAGIFGTRITKGRDLGCGFFCRQGLEGPVPFFFFFFINSFGWTHRKTPESIFAPAVIKKPAF